MFSIFKKKPVGVVDLSALKTDMHSHLLPGIDDGSPDVATSIELIKGLQDLGYQKFITTPHILSGMYENDANTIGQAYAVLQEEIQKQKLAVDISAAAEYFLDDHFDNLLTKQVPFLTIKDNLVLVEFSFMAISANYKNLLFQLQIKGFQPILAHPERYVYLTRNLDIFGELKSAGCLFQLNLLSLAGGYGKPTMELAHTLLKKDYIDLIGTDLHHSRHLQAIRNSPQVMPVINKLLDAGRLLNPSL
jgi:protein-tyrosine phosphatase